MGASNICLAFIPPYCVAESSIRPAAGILGAYRTHCPGDSHRDWEHGWDKFSVLDGAQWGVCKSSGLSRGNDNEIKPRVCFVPSLLLSFTTQKQILPAIPTVQKINEAALKSSHRNFVQENTEYPIRKYISMPLPLMPRSHTENSARSYQQLIISQLI